MDIRILLLAPGCKRNVRRMAKKMDYPIDLAEVRRYTSEHHEFVLVEFLVGGPSLRPLGGRAREHGRPAPLPASRGLARGGSAGPGETALSAWQGSGQRWEGRAVQYAVNAGGKLGRSMFHITRDAQTMQVWGELRYLAGRGRN